MVKNSVPSALAEGLSPNRTGVTLIEIMTVIAIIALLTTVITSSALFALKNIYRKKAVAMITALEGALALYYTDWGYYPVTGDGTDQRNGNRRIVNWNQPLVYALTGLDPDGTSNPKKGQPYMSFKKDDLDLYTGEVLLDPWGNAYVYVARKYVKSDGTLGDVSSSYGPFWPNNSGPSQNTYNIYSFGPSGSSNGNKGKPSGNYGTACYDEPADGNDVINNWSKQD